MFAASEVGIPVQQTAEERITNTANEKARLLDLGNGSSLPDRSFYFERMASSSPDFRNIIKVQLLAFCLD